MKLAACGNDCDHCPRFIATQSNEKSKLEEVARLWHRAGYRDKIVLPEAMACNGCIESIWCRYGIRGCTIERGVSNCGECEDYPCEDILKAVEQALAFAEKIKDAASEEDYRRLNKAFFCKRANLDKVHSERRKNKIEPSNGSNRQTR